MFSASIEHEVPFFDADSYRIVWHGHYVKYFEIARCKLLDELDCRYDDMEANGYFFPVIDLHIKYIKPLRFGQRIRIIATLKEWQQRLKIHYVVNDVETGEKLTKGHTIQVAIAMPEEITQFESPTFLKERIAAVLEKSQ